MCTVITCSCFLLHGTAWIKTKSETELIQRIRFLSKEYFFLLNLLKVLMLESISWGILLSITKERNMWTIFRCTIIQFQKVPYDLLILICLPLRDPDGKGLKRSPDSYTVSYFPGLHLLRRFSLDSISILKKYSLMNLLNLPFGIQSYIVKILSC